MNKINLNIIGMHCVSCSMNIDGELEDTQGVFSSNTSYARQQTEVAFDPQKISPKHIIAIIKRVGYDAKEIENSKLKIQN